MLGWLKALHGWVVGAEPWAAAYSWLSEHLPKLYEWLKERWKSLVGMIGSLGLGTWFASRIEVINALGWGAWPFIGLLFALGLAALFYVIASTIDRFKTAIKRSSNDEVDDTFSNRNVQGKLASGEIPSEDVADEQWNPRGLYISQPAIQLDTLKDDLFFTISFDGFNASGRPIRLDSEYGNIHMHQDGQEIIFPTPRIMHDRTDTREIPNYGRIFFVVEQRLPREMAKRLLDAIDSSKQVLLGLEHLKIKVTTTDNIGRAYAFPIQQGIVIRPAKDGDILSSQWARGSVSSQIG